MSDIIEDEADALTAKEKASILPPVLFVPRNDSQELATALAAVRVVESERRIRSWMVPLSGWLVAALVVVPLVKCLSIIENQHVPEDKIWVALQREDGSIPDPARPIDDQTESQRENTIFKFMYDYIDYHESYDADHVQHNYDWTRFMTADAELKDYTKFMNGPNSPTEIYGKTGERRIGRKSAARVGSDAFEVTYYVKIRTRQGIWLPEEQRRARISYAFSKNMPAEIARRVDPLRIVVTRYADGPATFNPDAPGGAQ